MSTCTKESLEARRKRSQSSPSALASIPSGTPYPIPTSPQRKSVMSRVGGNLKRLFRSSSSRQLSTPPPPPKSRPAMNTLPRGDPNIRRLSLSLTSLAELEPKMVSRSSVHELRSLAKQLDEEAAREGLPPPLVATIGSGEFLPATTLCKSPSQPHILSSRYSSSISSSTFYPSRSRNSSSPGTSSSRPSTARSSWDASAVTGDTEAIHFLAGPTPYSPVISRGSTERLSFSAIPAFHALEVKGLEFVAEDWTPGQEGELRGYLDAKLRELMRLDFGEEEKEAGGMTGEGGV
ncbi:hypothetical protein P7C70_g7866, partial [Phenoliferia sp. Uapishka_3]